ncbi:restriction endonuclease [Peptostreptococcaceae bacterium oral taxon 929]|nr:restriction endonuclease [Peptostreptococcaceae bacterium oral taxon 929]
MNKRVKGLEELKNVIFEPYRQMIYAFETQTVPNYLKVGDTYRPVAVRLKEWREKFPDLQKKYESSAQVDKDVYFRDYAVHKYLEIDLKKQRLIKDGTNEYYYSNEFFKDVNVSDIDEAVEDIKNYYNCKKAGNKYEYYSSKDKKPQEYQYVRKGEWILRENQKEVVDNFMKAINKGRKNLLMYAVMRFGKSFTSLSCALAMKAKLVLVVSAKADVKEEWKKNVEEPLNFKDYEFLDSKSLLTENIIETKFKENKKLVIFLTLQDLQGDEIKEKHREIFKNKVDLLIIDETHFGARGASFGKVLRNTSLYSSDEININKLDDEHIDTDEAENFIKEKNIKAKVKLHLSGTPYRILMGGEFEKEDIISFVQFSDIVKAQKEWDEEHLNSGELSKNNENNVEEWDNPYYGFPQMVRFAFNLNESSRKKLEELKSKGYSYELSKLLEPKSIRQSKDGEHKKFIHEKEVLDLLKVIDGSKDDDELFGFLDYDRMKRNNMCSHMVMVLPYCASCDAMEDLLKNNKFKNLNNYEIINISGLEASKTYKSPNDVKLKVKEFAESGQKTITLTVNRMLTGSTVEEWDTMLYLKDTASPQEYDQAIFRLQNQYVETLCSKETKKEFKRNLKPQTLLVDFDPYRLFRLQEQKALIQNINVDEKGNSKLKERIEQEIEISPIITMNKNQIKKVEAKNILDIVSEYNSNRSVADEVNDVPVDMSLAYDEKFRPIIEKQGEFNSKQGLSFKVTEDDDDGKVIDTGKDVDDKKQKTDTKGDDGDGIDAKDIDKENAILASKIKTYYQRILFYAFLCDGKLNSLDELIKSISTDNNKRLAKNLALDKKELKMLNKIINSFVLNQLDYKILTTSKRAYDESLEPLDRALTAMQKFDRMSESEVVTPKKVCEDMVKLLPEEGLRAIVDKKEKFLDLGCKAGEYAVALYNRLREELGYTHEEVRDLIYAIPTSNIAYEFTRKFYEILGLNIDNIATKFNAYDLLDIKNEKDEIDYEKIKNILEQDKKFSEIDLKGKVKAGGRKVNFGAVVGNPPYQENISYVKANSALSKQLFPYYVMLSMDLTSNLTSLIMPARWFTGDAQDKSFLRLRKYIQNKENISELHFFENHKDVFNIVEIKGGVCYFVSTNSQSKKIRFFKHNNNASTMTIRSLFLKGLDIVLTDNYQYEILRKVKDDEFAPLTDITTGRNAFGIIGKDDVIEKISKTKPFKNSCELRCKNNLIRYISEDEVKKSKDIFEAYKVFISKSAGAPFDDKKVIGQPYIGGKNTACSDSLIPIGKFDTLQEAKNLKKYLESKFLRYLVTLVKSSHNTTQIVYRFVPMQDFTNNSDIDWSKSIDEIDEQLFDKYELSEEERNIIKNSIKDM